MQIFKERESMIGFFPKTSEDESSNSQSFRNSTNQPASGDIDYNPSIISANSFIYYEEESDKFDLDNLLLIFEKRDFQER